MRSTKAFATVVAVLLTLGHALPAHAAREALQPIDTSSAGSSVDDVGSLRAAVSGADVVRMVERELVGATVFDLSFNDQGAAPSFDVKAYRDDDIWNTVVDVASGQIVRSAIVMSLSDLHGDDRRGISDLKRSTMALAEAIAIAEKYAPGKAVSAGLHRADGKLAFVVVVVSNGALKEIVIAADSKTRGKRMQLKQPVTEGARGRAAGLFSSIMG
jgi:hypothetical protein